MWFDPSLVECETVSLWLWDRIPVDPDIFHHLLLLALNGGQPTFATGIAWERYS